MIKVELGNRLLGISFEHKTIVEAGKKDPYYTHALGRPVLDSAEVRTTICTLYELEPMDQVQGKGSAPAAGEKTLGRRLTVRPLAAGKARCSSLDNFNKATGRKLALDRALKVLWPGVQDNPELTPETVHYNREQRAKVWTAYHARWVYDALKRVEEVVNQTEIATL